MKSVNEKDMLDMLGAYIYLQLTYKISVICCLTTIKLGGMFKIVTTLLKQNISANFVMIHIVWMCPYTW